MGQSMLHLAGDGLALARGYFAVQLHKTCETALEALADAMPGSGEEVL